MVSNFDKNVSYNLVALRWRFVHIVVSPMCLCKCILFTGLGLNLETNFVTTNYKKQIQLCRFRIVKLQFYKSTLYWSIAFFYHYPVVAANEAEYVARERLPYPPGGSDGVLPPPPGAATVGVPPVSRRNRRLLLRARATITSVTILKTLKKIVLLHVLKNQNHTTVKPRYNAVSGRHLLRPPYKWGAL